MTRRFLLSYLTVTFVVLVMLEVPLGVFYAQREDERLTNAIVGDATVIAMAYEDALQEGTGTDPAVASLYQERTGARVVVTDAAGISVIDTGEAVPRDFSTRPEIADALSGERASGTRRSDTLDTDLLYVAVPVGSGSSVFGAVRVTFDRHDITERIRRFWAGLLLLGVAVMAVMAVIGWTLARWITGPLRHLVTTAGRFAEGDLRVEAVDPHAPPEIAALWRTLNEMATRLDVLMAEQRSFVADASHQLRTPLTALRLRLENLEGDLRSGEAAVDDLEAALAETERLGQLVEDLLHLARADAAGEVVPVDLREVVGQRLDTWSAVADAGGVSLTGDPLPDGAWALAVPGGVEQALDNLLDNALRVAPRGSRVTVSLERRDHRMVVGVADQGPGLDDQEKVAALVRFWRGPGGRGSGLGLPIAAAVATASGGEIRLSDNPGGGLRVELRLPVAHPPDGGTEAGHLP